MSNAPDNCLLSAFSSRRQHYSDYCSETAVSSDEVHSFEAWCDSRKQQSSQFHFWYHVLLMELEILSLFREANFHLYIPSDNGWTNPILSPIYTVRQWLD